MQNIYKGLMSESPDITTIIIAYVGLYIKWSGNLYILIMKISLQYRDLRF